MEHIKPLNVRNTTASTATMMMLGLRQMVRQGILVPLCASSILAALATTGGKVVRPVRFRWQNTLKMVCRMVLTKKHRCVEESGRLTRIG